VGHLVGIDLGTTNSAIAFTELGRQRCLKVEKNEYTSAVLPSCVAMSRRGELLVGARALREPDPAREFKRHIGEDYLHVLGDRGFSPIELSAVVLRKLREGFEAEQGEIQGAVITVPAMFSERQRRETIEAGRLAGLEVLRVINEPSAAAIAYTLSDRPLAENTLVIDWGGGTLDVSLLDCEEDILDIKANAGDMKLGGHDIDRVVTGLLLEALARKGHDLAGDRLVESELTRIAEQIKIHLSDDDLWDEPIHMRAPPHFFEFELTRADFETAITPLVDRVFDIVRRALAKNPTGRVREADVSEVILVGGSCLLPLFRRRIERMFGRAPRISIDPMEVVALGAAYQARHAESSRAAEVVTLHSLTMNLGTSCAGHDENGVFRTDLFSCLLPAGTKIPARATNTYYTVQDLQTSVEVNVFEVEDLVERVTGLTPWETNWVSGLQPAAAGSFPIHLTFDYRVDQTLTVSVTVPGQGIEEIWIPKQHRELAARHDESRAKINEVFQRSLKRLSAYAGRVSTTLESHAGARLSKKKLKSLEEALSAKDLQAAIRAREALHHALFEEGVMTPDPGDPPDLFRGF
jgi:molecular chaperone DnaK (HSP70)